MILTGKAKEEFIKAKIGNEINLFESMLPIYKNALLIEWFDSVGIYITSDYFELNNGFYSEILDSNFEIIKPTRQEALTEAIKKANEIYNSK